MVQKVFDSCGIDEDVQGVTIYTSSKFEHRVEVITDRVAYDMSKEKIIDATLVGDMSELRDYIKECQI